MVQASGVDHVVLHCSDVERSRTFYTEILGMSVSREDDRRVFLQASLYYFEERINASPVVSDGVLYIGCEDYNFYAFQ